MKKFFVIFLLFYAGQLFSQVMKPTTEEEKSSLERFNSEIMKDFYFYSEMADLPKIEVDRFIKRKREDYKAYSDFVEFGKRNDEVIRLHNYITPPFKDFSFEYYLLILSASMRKRFLWRVENRMSEQRARQDVFRYFASSFPRTDYAGEWMALLTSDWTNKFIKK